MPNNILNIITIKGDADAIASLRERVKNDQFGAGSIDFDKLIPMPDTVYRGDLSSDEREAHGTNNWYDWSVANWNTKWNAYGYPDVLAEAEDNELRFYTAWSAPHPILLRMSEMAPGLELEHQWSDEFIGQSCGVFTYLNGEITDMVHPDRDSIAAYELSAAILGVDLKEEGFVLSEDGTEYIYDNTEEEGIHYE